MKIISNLIGSIKKLLSVDRINLSDRKIVFDERFTSYDNWVVENVLIGSGEGDVITDKSNKKTLSKINKSNVFGNKFIIRANNITNNNGRVLIHVGTSIKTIYIFSKSNIFDIRFNLPMGNNNIVLIKLSDYKNNTDVVLYSYKENVVSRYIKDDGLVSNIRTLNIKSIDRLISNVHITAKILDNIIYIFIDEKLEDMVDISGIYDRFNDIQLNVVLINKNKKSFSKEEAFLYINSVKVYD